MTDVLRIKRRAVGGAAGPPPSLAAAEIAFNEQDLTLYYGLGNSGGTATSIIPIAGSPYASFTTGSVVFAGATSRLAQDNANLFWDDTNNRLGIGTNTPAYQLDFNTTGATPGIRLKGAANAVPVIEAVSRRDDSNTTYGPKIGLATRRLDGVGISANNNLGYLAFGGQWGLDTTDQPTQMLYSASIHGVAEGTFTGSSAMPVAIAFHTGFIGNDIRGANLTYGTERMRITSGGLVTFTYGISFGSQVGTTSIDLSKHIALYGTTYGIGVTSGRINYVLPAGSTHALVVGGVDVASVNSTGLIAPTQAAGTNNTYVATTAFVQNAIHEGPVTVVTPVTGATVTMANMLPLFVNNATTLAVLTIKLPASPTTVTNTIEIGFLSPVTLLTIQNSAGVIVASAPTSAFGPGAALHFRYIDATIGWVYWK